MKYLLLAALLALVIVFVYSRLRPYLQLLQKILKILKGEGQAVRTQVSQREGKLLRCPGCQTWILESKAIQLGGGLASYCSSECLEKSAIQKEKKLAG